MKTINNLYKKTFVLAFILVLFGSFLKIYHFEFATLFLMLGLFFAPACVLLSITMVMAIVMHAVNGDGFKGFSHALESLVLFVGLGDSGPGKFSV
mgnify:CR=1 FL=1